MDDLNLNEHDRDRAALAASMDRTTAYVEELRGEQMAAPALRELTVDHSSSQLLDEAMDDINDGGDGNPAQFSNDA